jgi:ATP-binding cassette subfamily B protein
VRSSLALQVLRIVVRAGSHLLWLLVLIQAGLGTLSGLQVLVTRNSLTALLDAAGSADWHRLAVPVGLLVAVMTGSNVLIMLQNPLQRLLGERVTRVATLDLAEETRRAELAEFDRPQFCDDLRRAQLGAGGRITSLTVSATGLVRSVFTATGLVLGLVAVQPLLLVFAAIAIVPVWYASVASRSALQQFVSDRSLEDRRRGYLLSLLTARDAAKELRVYASGPYLMEQLRASFDARLRRMSELVGRDVSRLAVAALAPLAWLICTVVLVAVLLSSRRIGISEAATAILVTLQLGRTLTTLVGTLGSVQETSTSANDYSVFMRQASASRRCGSLRSIELPPLRSLSLRDVRFTYGQLDSASVSDGRRQKVEALRGLSMEIRRGDVVGVVGENGCGKSTLAKVLAGLYRPDAGSIEWNGADLSEVNLSSLAKRVSCVFQDYTRYMLSARENVVLGSWEDAEDVSRLLTAAHRSRADEVLRRLPEGYESLLGSIWPNGRELSHGQWQRLALARGLFKSADLLVLDEPTSALDPRAEQHLLEGLHELRKKQAIILISHRLEHMRHVDRVYVMAGGRVVACHTPGELLDGSAEYPVLGGVVEANGVKS